MESVPHPCRGLLERKGSSYSPETMNTDVSQAKKNTATSMLVWQVVNKDCTTKNKWHPNSTLEAPFVVSKTVPL